MDDKADRIPLQGEHILEAYFIAVCSKPTGYNRAYRTGWRIIPFLVTNVINYVILANTMAIM